MDTMLKLIVLAAGIAPFVLAHRIHARAQVRRTTQHWVSTIRSAPLVSIPVNRYDPARSRIYDDRQVLTPTRY